MTDATDSVATRFCYIYEEKYDYIYDENEDPNVSLLQKHMVLEFCFFESGAEFKKHTRCLVVDNGMFPRPDATIRDWEDRGGDGRYPCAIQTPNASKMLPGNFAYKDIWIPCGGDLIGHPGADLTLRNMPHHLETWEGSNETRDFYETLNNAQSDMKDAAEKLYLSPFEQFFADNHPIVSDNFEKWWQEWKTHWSNAESAKEASVISQRDKLSKKLLRDQLQNSDVEKKIMAKVYEKRATSAFFEKNGFHIREASFDRIRKYQQKIRIEAKTAAQIFVQKFAFSNHALLIRLCELMGGNKDLVKPIMTHVDDVTVLHLSHSAHLSAHVDDITVSEMQKLFDDKECSNQNYRAWEVLCHFFRPKEKKALYQLLHGKIDEHFDHLLTEVDEDVDDLPRRRPSSAVHHTTQHSWHTTRLQNPYTIK
jgi:hypothetical protein